MRGVPHVLRMLHKHFSFLLFLRHHFSFEIVIIYAFSCIGRAEFPEEAYRNIGVPPKLSQPLVLPIRVFDVSLRLCTFHLFGMFCVLLGN